MLFKFFIILIIFKMALSNPVPQIHVDPDSKSDNARDYVPPEIEEEIRVAFNNFDLDENGSISEKEIKHVLMINCQNRIAKEVENWIQWADSNGNGQINLVEIYEHVAEIGGEIEEEFLRRIFGNTDLDENGSLSEKEIKQAHMNNCKKHIAEEIDNMIQLMQSADRDGNGQINYEEFIAINSNEEPQEEYAHDVAPGPEGEIRDYGPPESEGEIREAFDDYDLDGNGSINATELKHALMAQCLEINGDCPRINDEEVDNLIQPVDMDGNGQINYEEFIGNRPKSVDEAFDDYDLDGNGSINATELKHTLMAHYKDCLEFNDEEDCPKINDEEVENMIQQADRDGNGQINFDEFTFIQKK